MTGDVEEFIHMSELDDAEHIHPFTSSKMVAEGTCIYTAAIPTQLAGNFPEGPVLQVMPDSAMVAVSVEESAGNSVAFKDKCFAVENDPPLNLLAESNSNKCESHASICSEETMDIDLSFLNEDAKCLNGELQGMITSSQSFNLLQNNLPAKSVHEQTSSDDNVVMIDVSKPIQLSQNSLIIVNGQKCVLQHDAQTGQVVAYPVKEWPQKTRRRRGRPRKTSTERNSQQNESEDNYDEEEGEKGLLQVVNDDGALVRRSSRKRKKAKILRDYETGNLKQELGSDVDDLEVADHDKKRVRGPGRPRKNDLKNGNRGRRKKMAPENEPTQAFLVQTADGQTLMMQVPLSSIPPGISLQEMAQEIANKLNLGLSQANESSKVTVSTSDLALQDHSVGSTTTFLQVQSKEQATLESGDAPREMSISSNDSKSTYGNLDHLTDHDFYISRIAKNVESTGNNHKKDSMKNKPIDDHSDVLNRITEEFNRKPPLDASKAATEGVAEKNSFQLESEKSSELNKQRVDVLLSAASNDDTVVSSTSDKDLFAKHCKICQMQYLKEEELIEHFKLEHPKCICAKCNYMNEHPYVVKRHAFRHANNGCICKICNKKYKDVYILKMHIKMVHLPPDVLYACEVCDKKFTRKAHLKRHLRIHASVKQFQCPHCDYKGCEKSDITKHFLIHEAPKFKCGICGKAFRHVKNKELHLKRHSGQRDYKCAACGFFGYTYTDIRKHIERRHSISCSHCKQIFTDIELLKEHKRMGHPDANNGTESPVVSEDATLLEDILDNSHDK